MKLPPLQNAGPVRTVALSPPHLHGQYLFASTDDRGWLFSWPDGRLETQIRETPILAALFKADGLLALCGAKHVHMVGLPKLDDRPSSKRVATAGVPGACWLDGDRLVTASYSPGRALLLDFMGNRLATFSAPGDSVWSVATNQRLIAVHSSVLTVWDDLTLTPLGNMGAHTPIDHGSPRFHLGPRVRRLRSVMPAVFGLAFTPSGRTLVSAGSDGRLVVWDPRAVEPIAIHDVVGHDGRPLDPRQLVLPDEDRAYLTTTTGLVRVELDSGRVDTLVRFQPHLYRWNTPIGADLTADRTQLLFAGLAGEVGVWDVVREIRVG